jgi:hypothetical protein
MQDGFLVRAPISSNRPWRLISIQRNLAQLWRVLLFSRFDYRVAAFPALLFTAAIGL